jgi:hypothetical protein
LIRLHEIFFRLRPVSFTLSMNSTPASIVL